MDENRLVEAALHGNLNAYNTLVLAHQDAVYNQACWMLGDPQDADDVVQEAFLRAYQKLNLYHGGSFKVWIMRIAMNLCYDELRRRKRKWTLPLEPQDDDGDINESPTWIVDHSPSPEDRMATEELHQFLHEQIQALPEDHRAVVVMVDIMEMNYNDAAAAIGKPIGTVKSRLARARRQLQVSINAFGKQQGARRPGDSWTPTRAPEYTTAAYTTRAAWA